jgi:copper homeostasis protein
MTDPVVLEICADSAESAVAAEQGGAHRIELCSNLLEGGITPSAGLISTVRSKIALELYVMIRPRGGDFCYTADEFEVMEQDVVTAKQLGADGIVFGILHEDGSIDSERTRQLVEIARPLKSTFHRAFDMSRDFLRSVEDLVECGVHRVLTSGGEQKVESAIPTVTEVVKAANSRIAIMVGGGINEANVRQIIVETGAREIHASVRTHQSSPMRHRNEKLSMGAVKGREYLRMTVSPDRVRRLLQAAIGKPQGVAVN